MQPNSVSAITWNCDKGLKLLMDDLQMYLHNHSLADNGDSGPNSSKVARLDDN